jgi:membrane protease YdiL (CAAX protease family)
MPAVRSLVTRTVGPVGRPPARALLGAGVATYVLAAAVLVATGTSRIRYSGDHDGTIPVWHVWVPALAASLVARAIPPRIGPTAPVEPTDGERDRVELRWCVAAAVAFATLPLFGTPPPDALYLAMKIGLLVVLPSVVLPDGGWWPFRSARPVPLPGWQRLGPVAAVATWLALAYAGPFVAPSTGRATVLGVLGGFVLNAVVEERFYRVLLQTRLEAAFGRWPAILTASLLWSAWHVAIQSTGEPAVDLATVVAHQGVLGLFLGYLWSRYRRIWPLLAVHAAVNASWELVATLW